MGKSQSRSSRASAAATSLASCPVGAQRESPDDLTPYRAALERLSADPNQHLMVA
ncbi:GNAT family N-acetyltransferase, partial [Streptomyces sp. NPDC002265]